MNESITNEIPYGFLLAAPVNFSIKTRDAYAQALRKKGVTEYFLWGMGELEHALMMPKNDRIMFAFFGISLVINKRTKTTEKRFQVNNKNKLLRVLGSFDVSYQPILLRDIDDIEYPWEDAFKKSKRKLPWEEHIIQEFHPKGLLLHVKEHYAYYDKVSNQVDFTEAVDLINRPQENLHRSSRHNPDEYKKKYGNEQKIEFFYKNLPHTNQATYHLYGFVFFEDMLLIDDKGDGHFEIPHIYVQYDKKNGPFSHTFEVIKDKDGTEVNLEHVKRGRIFPKEFPEIKRGNIYKERNIEWSQETARLFHNGKINKFHDIDGKYSDLKKGDILTVKPITPRERNELVQITHIYSVSVGKYSKTFTWFDSRERLQDELGREVSDDEQVTVYEIMKVWEHDIEND